MGAGTCDYPGCDRTDTAPTWSDPDSDFVPLCGDHAGPQVDEPEPWPALTDAEFRVAREDLGLTVDQTAVLLGVAERTIARWEAGDRTVPDTVAAQVGGWTDSADAVTDAWVARLLDVPDPVLVIPRRGSRDGWPAGWWRAVAARIVEQVPGCRVVYTDG